MPQAVGDAFVKFVIAAGASTAGTVKAAYVIGKFVGTLALTAGLNKVSMMLLGKPRIGRVNQTVEYTGSVEPRRIIYGKLRVSGMNVIPPFVSAENFRKPTQKNWWLHQVLAIAGHEVNSITTVWFNQDQVGTIASDGEITSGTYNNRAWVRRYTGTDTQTVDDILERHLTEWTTDHRGRGVAYLALCYFYDTKVFSTGKPTVSCLVEGRKVYDPRLDSTQTAISGSGSHRVDDPATYEYSTNPALCVVNYLLSDRVGLGESASRIDWESVADAADICDETVTVPNGSGGSTTQKRYTCNTVLLATDRFEDNLEILTTAMLGACYYSGGKWRIHAGAWSSSAFTITDDDIIDGGVDVTTALNYNERYNGVRGKFVDESRNYQLTEFPAVQSASYVTNDGEAAWREVEWPSTTNVYEAQRNAILTLRQSRNGQRATLRCGMSAWKIRPFETGTITLSELGWTNKTVRCESWSFNPAGSVDITVREEVSTDWSDPILTDYTEPLNISDPVPESVELDPPTGLTATGVTTGITLAWTAPDTFPPTSRYQVYEHTSSTPFASGVKIWEGNATSVFVPKSDTTTRYYWVRVIDEAANTSATEPASVGVPGAAGSVGTALNASASPSSLSVTGSGTSLTTSSTTVTASGGTAGYAYAWTKVSGDTITADSASAATTTFSAATLASGETRTAIFRCTVTDSASPANTKTVDVSVSIARSAMTAAASPTSLYKFTTTSSGTTSSTTVTPTGGVSSYTYAWTKVSGGSITAVSSSSATTTFTATSLLAGASRTAVFRCTVTDSSSPALTATADVTVTIERDSGTGGGGGGPIP